MDKIDATSAYHRRPLAGPWLTSLPEAVTVTDLQLAGMGVENGYALQDG